MLASLLTPPLWGGPRALAQDRPLGTDKALHFMASAGLSSAGYVAASPWLETRPQRLLVSAGATLLVGGAKEAYDASGGGTPSAWDLTWDALGALTGATVALLLDLAFTPPASGPSPAQHSNRAVRTQRMAAIDCGDPVFWPATLQLNVILLTKSQGF